ncbi:MAG: dihydroorotate dehydrogenase electron transfer subunit, partial [Candidatus Aminicenantales bacterium]
MIKDPQARITRIESWKDYHLFSLRIPAVASEALPGQFVMVRVADQLDPLLRRPFSIHSKTPDGIEIFFQRTGTGTSLLSQKKTDETLDIIGPLGKGFTISEDLRGKDVAVVGGGRGIAPLYFLAQRLRHLGAFVKIFYGGKSIQDLPLKEKFEEAGFELFCSTDDGSFGFKGLVSDFFSAELARTRPSFLFSCGPELMMEKIAHLAQSKNIPAEFSLEANMGCGIGACWGCVRKIKREKEKIWLKIC